MISEVITQCLLSIVVGFMPLANAKNSDLTYTMNSENEISLEQTQRIIRDNKQSTIIVPQKTTDSLGMLVTSKSAIVVDAASGKILWQKNPRTKLPIASLSKLMTLQVFLDQNVDMTKEYVLQPDENALIGAKLREPDGTRIRIQDLFGSSLIGSANNATLALARSTGLSDEEFVEKMNEKAENWGLTNTSFMEPTGLNEGNQSTVADYAKIALEAFNREPIKTLANDKYYEFTIQSNDSHHKVQSTNKILDTYLFVEGTKTGFTYEAGYCLATLIQKDGHEIIVITFGNESDEGRITDTKALAEWAFKNYTWSNQN